MNNSLSSFRQARVPQMCQGPSGAREYRRRGWSAWNRLRENSWRNIGRRIQLGRVAEIGLLPSQDANHLWEYVHVAGAKKYKNIPRIVSHSLIFLSLWSGERPSSEDDSFNALHVLFFADELSREEDVLEWLIENKSTGDDEDVIEEVTAKTLGTLIQNIDNLVVVFCKNLYLEKNSALNNNFCLF